MFPVPFILDPLVWVLSGGVFGYFMAGGELLFTGDKYFLLLFSVVAEA